VRAPAFAVQHQEDQEDQDDQLHHESQHCQNLLQDRVDLQHQLHQQSQIVREDQRGQEVLVLPLRLEDPFALSHLPDLVVRLDQANRLGQSRSYQVDLPDQVDLQGPHYLLVLLVQVHPVDQWDLVVQVQHVRRQSLVVQLDQAHPPLQVVQRAQVHLQTIPDPPQFVATHGAHASYLQHPLPSLP